MATYVPANLITTKAFGNGSANIATWRKVAAGGVTDIHRTLTVETPTAARTVTLQQGATGVDTTSERIADALALVANVPTILNWWVVVLTAEYFQGFANSTDINGSSYGYTYT